VLILWKFIFDHIFLDAVFENLSRKMDVEKLCTSRGNDADGLLKDCAPKTRHQKILQFSKGPHKNSPDTTTQKPNQDFIPVAFPPIHNAHHNKKSSLKFI